MIVARGTFFKLFFAMLLLSVCFYGCKNSKDIEYLTVTGSVSDNSGQPLPAVAVSMEGHRATTNDKGEFVFTEVIPGNYTITFEKEDYISLEHVFVFTIGRPTKVNVTLESDPIVKYIKIDPSSLDFGPYETELVIKVLPDLRKDARWSLDLGDSKWLSAEPSSGVWAPGDSEEIKFTVDRTSLDGPVSLVAKLSADDFILPFSVSCSLPDLTSQIEISDTELDFGATIDSKTITIAAIGTGPSSWISYTECDALDIKPTGGIIRAGESQQVTVNLDRKQLTGDLDATIAIICGDAIHEIKVKALMPKNPDDTDNSENSEDSDNSEGSEGPEAPEPSQPKPDERELPKGLTAYFPFSGNVDDEESFATAIIHGSISYAENNTAVDFTTTSDAYIGIEPALIDCRQWTMSFNIKCKGNGNILWVETAPDSDNKKGVSQSLSFENSTLKYIMSRSENWNNYTASYYNFSRSAFNDDEWHHIVISSSMGEAGSTTITSTLYVDGEKKSQIYEHHDEVKSPHLGKAKMLHIGGSRTVNYARTLANIHMELSTLRIYSGLVLSASEVKTLYQYDSIR
ncbi:MAG: carboxypeptidase regulatory-like domain-containing protein [Muribaculaceae bacterium]|nr:carboxypeptidase regulatory-like domain-containing protein [Muribaculaceae bacterium]